MLTNAMEQNDSPESLQGNQRFALPISKLRGLSARARHSLKLRRITTCGQLLRAAATAEQRQKLSESANIDATELLRLVQRADLARVNGIGVVFCMMLEDLEVDDVGKLANQDPEKLHGSLKAHNDDNRLARRSPTPEEVEDWVTQARQLGEVITY